VRPGGSGHHSTGHRRRRRTASALDRYLVGQVGG
jgi:hypothetical protein